MKKWLYLTLVYHTSLLCTVLGQFPIEIGTYEPSNLTIYTGRNTTDEISFQKTSFLYLHFASFELPLGDSVIVSSTSDSHVSFTYTHESHSDAGTRGRSFFSGRIPGKKARIQYRATHKSKGKVAFRIDKFSRSKRSIDVLKVCGGKDNSVPAKCALNDPFMHDAWRKSLAIARLIINGKSACTGWLVGSEGHLLTNHHCIGSEDDAMHTEFEFRAESDSCDQTCEAFHACPGTVVSTKATLVSTSEILDFTLVKIQTKRPNDLLPYGYFTLRASGAVLNERIYIPQHPQGFGKRIAWLTEKNVPAKVDFVNHSSSCGENRIGYDADTQPGSSGSPVVALDDQQVIALHNCGAEEPCQNAGIDITHIIYQLIFEQSVPLNAIRNESLPALTLPPGYTPPGYTTRSPATCSPISSNTTTPSPSASNQCRVFTKQSTCATILPGKCKWIDGKCRVKVKNNIH